jgi:hypothetical protein
MILHAPFLFPEFVSPASPVGHLGQLFLLLMKRLMIESPENQLYPERKNPCPEAQAGYFFSASRQHNITCVHWSSTEFPKPAETTQLSRMSEPPPTKEKEIHHG